MGSRIASKVKLGNRLRTLCTAVGRVMATDLTFPPASTRTTKASAFRAPGRSAANRDALIRASPRRTAGRIIK